MQLAVVKDSEFNLSSTVAHLCLRGFGGMDASTIV